MAGRKRTAVRKGRAARNGTAAGKDTAGRKITAEPKITAQPKFTAEPKITAQPKFTAKSKIAARAEADAPPTPRARQDAGFGVLRPPVGLAGCGVEGLGTLAYLRAHGLTEIRLFDRGLAERHGRGEPLGAELEGLPLCGEEQWPAELARCGTVFRSPGVRPDHPGLAAARVAGADLTSASTWFLAHCPAPVVGVTGTVGKGTAATLIHEALRACGLASRLAGNIGLNPLAFLDQIEPDQPVVLELSSFQLMDLGPVKPAVAVVLRTSEDHLDWHRDVDEYFRAKAGLLAAGGTLPSGARQTVIFCADAAGSRAAVAHALGPGLPGALAVSRLHAVRDGIGVRDGQVLRFRAGVGERLEVLERLALPGPFNLENAAAAYLAAEALGAAGERAQRALAEFRGLPHRLERVGTVGGVECYDDSYATRPDATVAALDAFDRPLALILGGSEKHADFRALAETVCRHPSLRRVLLIGATAERLRGEMAAAAARLEVPVPACTLHPGLPEAFAAGLAALSGARGGVLLLSPACASFGLFPNYKVRGERFQALVHEASAE